MLRQSVNSAATRYISAGAQAQASSANNASQMSQPRMRRDSGCEGTTIAAISGLTAGASIWVAMSAIAKTAGAKRAETPGRSPALLARNHHQWVLEVPAANSAIIFFNSS